MKISPLISYIIIALFFVLGLVVILDGINTANQEYANGTDALLSDASPEPVAYRTVTNDAGYSFSVYALPGQHENCDLFFSYPSAMAWLIDFANMPCHVEFNSPDGERIFRSSPAYAGGLPVAWIDATRFLRETNTQAQALENEIHERFVVDVTTNKFVAFVRYPSNGFLPGSVTGGEYYIRKGSDIESWEFDYQDINEEGEQIYLGCANCVEAQVPHGTKFIVKGKDGFAVEKLVTPTSFGGTKGFVVRGFEKVLGVDGIYYFSALYFNEGYYDEGEKVIPVEMVFSFNGQSIDRVSEEKVEEIKELAVLFQ